MDKTILYVNNFNFNEGKSVDKFMKNKIGIIEDSIKKLKDRNYTNDEMKDFKNFQYISINMEKIITSILDLTTNFINSKNIKINSQPENIFRELYKNKIIDEDMVSVIEEVLSFRYISLENSKEADVDSIKKIIENKINYTLEYAYIISSNTIA
ncbi:hypothetical protein [Clostridium sp.]|uniref:hypothetical protein n=1 Tax=Clostridium sp. TaxID=1506 RepID=UPI003464CD99